MKQINARGKLIHILSEVFKTVAKSEKNSKASHMITRGKERDFQQSMTQKTYYSYTLSCIKPKEILKQKFVRIDSQEGESILHMMYTYILCVTGISDK